MTGGLAETQRLEPGNTRAMRSECETHTICETLGACACLCAPISQLLSPLKHGFTILSRGAQGVWARLHRHEFRAGRQVVAPKDASSR